MSVRGLLVDPMQYHSLQTDIVRIIWQIVRRITIQILGVERLIRQQTNMHISPAIFGKTIWIKNSCIKRHSLGVRMTVFELNCALWQPDHVTGTSMFSRSTKMAKPHIIIQLESSFTINLSLNPPTSSDLFHNSPLQLLPVFFRIIFCTLPRIGMSTLMAWLQVSEWYI